MLLPTVADVLLFVKQKSPQALVTLEGDAVLVHGTEVPPLSGCEVEPLGPDAYRVRPPKPDSLALIQGRLAAVREGFFFPF